VDRADADDGEHRGHRLGDHGHVDGDAVALADAQALEDVREALDLVGQLGVRHASLVPRLALPQQRHAVAVARLDMAVEAVVGDVELAVGEPLREGRVGPVEYLGERRVPVECVRLRRPERISVAGRLGIQLGRGDRVVGEVGSGRESAVFVEEVVDLTAGGEGVRVGVAHGSALLCGLGGGRRAGEAAMKVPAGRRVRLPPIVGAMALTDPGDISVRILSFSPFPVLRGSAPRICCPPAEHSILALRTRSHPPKSGFARRHPIPPMGCRHHFGSGTGALSARFRPSSPARALTLSSTGPRSRFGGDLARS
jgi:hypothetical protein